MAAALTFMRKQRWGPQSKRSSSSSSGEDVQGKMTMCRPGSGWSQGQGGRQTFHSPCPLPLVVPGKVLLRFQNS